ncbi:MAG: HAD family hydrolase [Deltaproteobacteria bacterium]|nr:MAG: HAD family hydrolase [Deltaproteobacteria bacterium]
MDRSIEADVAHLGAASAPAEGAQRGLEVPASARPSDAEIATLLSGQRERGIPRRRRVYVNRTLRMDRIRAVGFDMDYTLAPYRVQRMEAQAFELTVEVLVRERGYPAWLRQLRYDTEFMMRGLVVDTELGNVLKMDRFGHVGRVYHGRRPLTKEERFRLYRQQKIDFDSPRWVWLDTLFALPEAALYAEVIEEAEARGEPVDYATLYRDIRASIDQVHRDGSLKAQVRRDLEGFIVRDPELGPMLHRLRSSGKRLFVLTNSDWSYTDTVMRHLLDGVLPEYPSWRSYFDLVIVDAGKPGWFTEQRPFRAVNPGTGSLDPEPAKGRLVRGGVYSGGNLRDFEQWTELSGESVLYIGDHIYGDIVRTKRSGLWRTCMVVQELEDEIAYVEGREAGFDRLRALDDLRFRLDDEILVQKAVVAELEDQVERAGGSAVAPLCDRLEEARRDLARLRDALKAVLGEMRTLAEDLERGYNAYWGLLFKEGAENSRFGEQVEDYACLYTGRVTNFLFYAPSHYFRSRREEMPHESVAELSARTIP